MLLYEKFGSFVRVAKYYREAHDGLGPSHYTIKQRLQKKFLSEGRNFEIWIEKYYNPMTERIQLIGNFVHAVIEEIFIRFTRNLSLNSFFEVKPCKYNSNNICDNSIVRDSSFKKFIEQQQNLIHFSERIILINIDFTLSTQNENIRIKCFKNYHGSEKFLIIVLLSIDISNYNPLKNVIIPYASNVKILNFKEFAQFMGYSRDPKLLKEYYNIIQIARDAITNDNAFKKLKKLAQNTKHNLREIAVKLRNKLGVNFNPIQQEGFEYILKSLNLLHLLYKERSDFSLDKFIF